MASPATGRHTYARRAHYGAFISYVIAIVGLVAGLLSAIIWVVDPVGFANLRTVVLEATAPVGRVITGGTGAVAGTDEAIAAWWRAGSQNRELRQRLTEAQRDLVKASSLEAENRQLRALLNLSQGDVRPIVTATILSSSASSTRRYAIVDAGHSDGVRSGQPVRSADGLIGRTLEVGPTVARVLLITDPRSVVPAQRASDGLSLLVFGRGDDILDVRTLNNATISLKTGDILVTSGSGGIFHPRTPLARIIGLTRDGALARAIADPSAAAAIVVEPARDADIDAPPPESDTVADGMATADEGTAQGAP